MPGHGPCPDEQRAAPAIEIADILRAHGDAYRREHRLSKEQRSAMRAINTCRTAVLGGHVDVCDSCGFQRPAYNSCRNRHCPKCQSLAQGRWIEQRMGRILPTHYFHVVFTLPAALRPLVLGNRRLLLTLLFQAASRTLLELGRDPRRLGAALGITAVLHTWTRTLDFHPHLHCLVTGGGLSLDDQRWVSTTTQRYLFPARVLSALFRGKFLDALTRAYRAGKLELTGHTAGLADPQAFQRFLDPLYRQDWVVYAKKPFAGAAHVFQYLGRYTHRVAISNQRLLSFDADGVRFRTRNADSATLAPQEFIRRFLLHVLPDGFVKIRHYGVFAPANIANKLALSRNLLATDPADRVPDDQGGDPVTKPDWRQQLAELTGVDLSVCPRCERGFMIRCRLPLRDQPSPTTPRLLPIPDG